MHLDYRSDGFGVFEAVTHVAERAHDRVTVGLGEVVADRHGGKRYEGLTPHDLRHAAASFAIAAGASVKGVQGMLAHQSATQTLDRYAALWPDELDAVAARIDAARQAADNSRPDRESPKRAEGV